MAREETWKCDLCGEYVHKDALTRLRVGRVDWRPEDFHPVDVCPACTGKPVSEVLTIAAEHDEGMVH